MTRNKSEWTDGRTTVGELRGQDSIWPAFDCSVRTFRRAEIDRDRYTQSCRVRAFSGRLRTFLSHLPEHLDLSAAAVLFVLARSVAPRRHEPERPPPRRRRRHDGRLPVRRRGSRGPLPARHEAVVRRRVQAARVYHRLWRLFGDLETFHTKGCLPFLDCLLLQQF